MCIQKHHYNVHKLRTHTHTHTHTHIHTYTHTHTHTHTREPTQFRHALNSSILTIGLYRHTSTHTRKCAYKFSIFQGLQCLRMDDGALTANSEDKKIAWKKLS